MFDFGVFCHLLRLMGIYRVGPPSGYLKSFVLSFLPFFFSILFHSSFFPSLSGATFISGAPGHCPPIPPSRYATVMMNWNVCLVNTRSLQFTICSHMFLFKKKIMRTLKAVTSGNTKKNPFNITFAILPFYQEKIY